MITRLKKWITRPVERIERPALTLPGKRTGSGLALGSPSALDITAALLSDIGCRRALNEDCGRWIEPGDAATLARKGVLMIVADGMGGHAAGDVAGNAAVEIISRVYYESQHPPQRALEEAFHAANRTIFAASQARTHLRGMGTTCTALAIHEGAGISAQVGDSRLYLARGEEIYLMSEDHSAVMEMVRRGEMTAEDARHHSDKNILLRALGVQREVGVATWQTPFPTRDGDHFVLCSDGLYDLVAEPEIKQIVTNDEPHAACERLIALAKERGGHDNITAGIIRVRASGAPAPGNLRFRTAVPHR